MTPEKIATKKTVQHNQQQSKGHNLKTQVSLFILCGLFVVVKNKLSVNKLLQDIEVGGKATFKWETKIEVGIPPPDLSLVRTLDTNYSAKNSCYTCTCNC